MSSASEPPPHNGPSRVSTLTAPNTGSGGQVDPGRIPDHVVRYFSRGDQRLGGVTGAPSWPQDGTNDQFQSLQTPTPTTKTGFSTDHKCAFWGLN